MSMGALLPCGTDLDTLVDEVADGHDPARVEHERTCPHCQAALADLEGVWGQVRALASEDVGPREDLVRRVIAAIRHSRAGPGAAGLVLEDVVPRMLRHAWWAEQRGATRIADAVVGEIAARAARSVPGVRALVRGATAALRTPEARAQAATRGVAVDVDGRAVTIGVRLVVDLTAGRGIAQVGEEVRGAVVADVERLTGLEVRAVNVVIDAVDAGE